MGLGIFFWLFESVKNGPLANFSEFKIPTHIGTHVEDPGYVIDPHLDAGFDVDTVDLEVLNCEDGCSILILLSDYVWPIFMCLLWTNFILGLKF